MRNLKVMWRLAFTFSLLLALALLAVGAAVLGMQDVERHAAALERENVALLGASAALLQAGEQRHAEAAERVQRVVAAAAARQRDGATAGQDAAHRAQLLVAAVVLFGVLVGIASTWAVTRGIVRPLHFAARTAERVAEGDLRHTVQRAYRDETGRVVRALGDMQGKLNTLVRAMRDSAGSVNSAAERISAGNTDLAARTGEQASALQPTAASVEKLTAMVTRNSEGAGSASGLAREACALAEGSGEAVSGVAQRMQQIVKASRNVSDIVGVMDEIAFQTNLLALNAAVEAARAGEQGRGFAVVAAQVRLLAQRSAEAARDIKKLVGDAVGEADHGAREARQAGESMAGVVRVVREVARLVTEIAAASQEQRAGIQQVNTTIAHMDAATRSNAALVQEINGHTRLLLAQARQLLAAASRFQLDDDDVAAAPASLRAPAATSWQLA